MHGKVVLTSTNPPPGREELAALWSQLSVHFDPDDAFLRDIYVQDTTAEHWRRFLNWLNTNPYPVVYRYLDEPDALPGDASRLIRFYLGGIWIHCHPFAADEIELDLQAFEVNSPEQ